MQSGQHVIKLRVRNLMFRDTSITERSHSTLGLPLERALSIMWRISVDNLIWKQLHEHLSLQKTRTAEREVGGIELAKQGA